MDSIRRIVESGICTGCGACNVCPNISFETGAAGFPAPVVGPNCTGCGKCLLMCIYDPDREDDD